MRNHAVLFLLGFILAIILGGVFGQPNCPQEDSCYADYYNGAWHIIPGERP